MYTLSFLFPVNLISLKVPDYQIIVDEVLENSLKLQKRINRAADIK